MPKRTPSWGVSDALWERIAPLVAGPGRNPRRACQRKPGGGRKPLQPRRVFEGIVSGLRTGCQWKALPKERFGSPSSIHTNFQRWQQSGVFLAIWRAGLAECDEMEGIAWDWQSLDGGIVKAPMAQQAVGRNPTDRGKKRNPTSFAGRHPWSPAVPRRNRRQPA